MARPLDTPPPPPPPRPLCSYCFQQLRSCANSFQDITVKCSQITLAYVLEAGRMPEESSLYRMSLGIYPVIHHVDVPEPPEASLPDECVHFRDSSLLQKLGTLSFRNFPRMRPKQRIIWKELSLFSHRSPGANCTHRLGRLGFGCARAICYCSTLSV